MRRRLEQDERVERKVEIFCPKCAYRPVAGDRWCCAPGCHHVWHTFDTCGVCPQCGKNWEDTACPACWKWSRHVEWYHETVNIPQKKVEGALAECAGDFGNSR